ncbi:MAG: hypothetical protein U9O98_01180 [Asgard group archaeon]|nr:hypothetical protein [Asgard group archaeon]
MITDPSKFLIISSVIIGFILLLFTLLFLLKIIFSHKRKHSDSKEVPKEAGSIIHSTVQHLTYNIPFFGIILIFFSIIFILILSYSIFNNPQMKWSDYWPFYFVVIVCLLTCILLISPSKRPTKRRIQKELRKM